MKLKDWLYFNNIKIKHFAQQIGVSRVALHYIISKGRVCTPRIAQKIIGGTMGEVGLKDLIPKKKLKKDESKATRSVRRPPRKKGDQHGKTPKPSAKRAMGAENYDRSARHGL